MTGELVARARAALEGITDGPWEATGYGVEQPYEFDLHRFDQMPLRIARTDQSDADSRFIAAARDLVPELADRVEALEAERDEARTEVDRMRVTAGMLILMLTTRASEVEDRMLAADTAAETSRYANELAGIRFALGTIDSVGVRAMASVALDREYSDEELRNSPYTGAFDDAVVAGPDEYRSGPCGASHPYSSGFICSKPPGHAGEHGYAGCFWTDPQ